MAANSGVISEWTDEQDTVVIGLVRKHKDNGGSLSSAFAEASGLLGRSDSSIRNRWNVAIKAKYQSGSDAPAVRKKFIKPLSKKKLREEAAKEAAAKEESKGTPEIIEIAEVTSSNGESNNKTIAGEVVLQEAGIHVIHNDDDPLPPGTSPALISRADLVDEPYIKVAVAPITKAQLSVMTESELYELLANVSIRLQEVLCKREADAQRSKKELQLLSQEYNEVKVGYTSLLGVINHARELAMDQNERLIRPAFTMERNGNLNTVK